MPPSTAPPASPLYGESQERRDFYQSRLALFSKTGFLLSSFFLVSGNLIDIVSRWRPVSVVFTRSNGWHLVAASVSAVVWLVTRRPERRLGQRALVALDLVGTVLPLAAYSVMAASNPGATRLPVLPRLDLLLQLITLFMLTARAMLVPSTLGHTLVVSVCAAVPVHVLAYWVFATVEPEYPQFSVGFGLANTAIWSVAGIILVCLASRIIYGLRAEIKAAQRLGQYLLEEKIGEGGMGSVYRASHALLRRPTAIKLLRPERAGAESSTRFEREVQLTSRLTHPNTVSIFDYGHTPEGVFYYAMEYLDGINLAELVERYGPQPPSRVVHLMTQVCSSLAEAHAIGLVHRDVKPANIIISERGGVPDVAKVVDFGLVKEIRKEGDVTQNDTVMGTPHYLAPESIKNADDVDARADLYALGAVGYFLLSGAPVFEGTGIVEICAKHLHEAPAPLSERAAQPVPADLEALLMRCLAKDPAERPESALALREALLACAVPSWTETDARAFWREHGGAPKRTPIADADRQGNLTIDVRQRPSPKADASIERALFASSPQLLRRRSVPRQ